MSAPALGVCYYPEHWPESIWAEDARRMKDLGLSFVRIGEFAWSRLEPKRGDLRFDWLERSIDTLHGEGLKVVLGTPTATPPKWLVDEMPDMLPVDENGHRRAFGSRRHYDFSHEGYREECARIVTALAERFGNHPGIAAWQTDNEYDCHGTALSYSPVALAAYRAWLKEKYGTIDALNTAWGNVFWSMEVDDFDRIELPIATIADANPPARMDFRRFASDQVVSFNRLQADIIRKHSPGRDVIHNFMGRTTTFDHFDVGADIDVTSWDAYPLGFLDDRSDRDDEWKRRFMRAGDPDFQAFHHDIYRATSNGRWWIMEQQPGPVNWASHNPTPREGQVRLWTWEAFAHGAEVVSYFRWRQAPFAQEQMHAGLLRPDSGEAPAFPEAKKVAEEIAVLDIGAESGQSAAAIVFDYPSSWAWEIEDQGAEFDYFRVVFDTYCAMRRLGLSIDIVPASVSDLSGYGLVAVPALFAFTENLTQALAAFEGEVLLGPRSGAKTKDFAIPESLPPDLPADMLDMKVARVESLRGDVPVPTGAGAFRFWREFVEVGPKAETELASADGEPALVRQGNLVYMAGWGDEALLEATVKAMAERAGLSTVDLPDGVRLRRRGRLVFAVNYGNERFDLTTLGLGGTAILGSADLAPSGVAILEGTR
ncbi:beta-galactosidase [Pararhizobium mangrovi]|uniref:Beta-galactosidase n=1 Tax=Pararhizobium mangrovi TaxID=2590452 RepID=A0A506U338_9HYPH|nr:beta-galactosidase [Pararhizobium mangrovi]TPW27405.1 beta-galactosidase [Pararhizobium mangrovi]